jgi:hypothetical protein
MKTRGRPRGGDEAAMPFAGVLYREEDRFLRARERLQGLFGPVLMETPAAPWRYSDYYAGELGSPLKRRFLFFENLIGQAHIREMKLRAIEVESELSIGPRRTVNIDPGYLTLAKVVLASTKDYSHRVCLGEGIYAEATLIYRKGAFRPHQFTYRDYLDHAGVFAEARELLKARLRAGS